MLVVRGVCFGLVVNTERDRKVDNIKLLHALASKIPFDTDVLYVVGAEHEWGMIYPV